MEKNEFDILLEKANAGDLEAQNDLGNKYYNGDENVTLNHTEAVKWYRKAAEAGYLSAQYNLGQCYKSGEGVVQDNVKALEWITKAAQQDDIDALNYVANVLRTGEEEIEPNIKKAMKYYLRSAQLGNPTGMFMYGFNCTLEDKVTEGVEWLEKVVKIDSDYFGLAHMRLAMIRYYTENSNEKEQGLDNLKTAAKAQISMAQRLLWIEQHINNIETGVSPEILDSYLIEAANNNDTEAIYYAINENILGYSDNLTPEDIIKKLEMSANDDVVDAQVLLGKKLLEVKRFEEALNWFLKASKANHKEGYYQLALLYSKKPRLTKEEINNIVLLMEEAVKQNHFDATVFLANLFEKNDPEKAKIYHEKLALLDYNPSLYFLYDYAEKKRNIKQAIHYCERITVDDVSKNTILMNLYKIDKNYPKYFENAKISAEAGIKEAMVELGYIYKNGLGVKQDYQTALKWFMNATNNPEAQYMLGKFYEQGYGVTVDYEKAVEYYQQASLGKHAEASLELTKYKKTIFGKWKRIN